MRHFRFRLKDKVIRGMTRNQYYAASHWARYCGWLMESRINWGVFDKHFQNTALYGCSKIRYLDMLL
ncbi:hypothetical protein LCGC14_1305780 [marine sediment metagenome]|uniref:Uncharacterized protein n=1 Tax=marine sediment metagenome TaxID=412755 RepID=A0A0F9N531_9ZZZZ